MRILTYHSGRDGTKKPNLKKNKDITKDNYIKVFPSILSIKFLCMWQFSNLKLSSRTCHSETLVYRFHHSTTHQLYGLQIVLFILIIQNILQWNLDKTKGQGTGKNVFTFNEVSLRFFSILFTIIGVAKIVCYTEDSAHTGS